MLFNSCNCRPASSFSRRGLICGGSAGFVSALISTLIGSSRTARARPLGRAVPEIDRLAVRIVTDNIVITFVPSEKREGLSIERRGYRIPNAPPRTALNGEWGLSMHAESHRGNEVRNILVDFGYTAKKLRPTQRGGVELVVADVRIGTGFEQLPCDVDRAALDGHMQRRAVAVPQSDFADLIRAKGGV